MKEKSLSAILYSTQGTRICWKYDVLQVLPSVESRWGTRFSAPAQTVLESTQPPAQRVSESLSWGKAAARGLNHPPTFGAEVKERVAVNLYSLSVPSWTVLSWTLISIATGPKNYEFHYSVSNLCQNCHWFSYCSTGITI